MNKQTKLTERQNLERAKRKIVHFSPMSCSEWCDLISKGDTLIFLGKSSITNWKSDEYHSFTSPNTSLNGQDLKTHSKKFQRNKN